MKNIALLGSTGSVGRNVLDIVRHYPDEFRVSAISSNENISLLAEQAEEFNPSVVAIGNEAFYPDLKNKISGDSKIASGAESLEEIASDDSADIIFMAISGTSALKPLIAALRKGKTVALASKEPVVSAGMIVRKVMEDNNAGIIPVDSEHSAIMQCLSGRDSGDVRTLYITGSGGSLKDKPASEFDSLTTEEVLNHPKWDMGRKITVDSATLMNKGLEVIEARWLFDVPQERIKVLIHPEAVIHSMVEFSDGTINAGMFSPDMRFPILRALAYPEILESDLPRVDFSMVNTLSFQAPDTEKFPALKMAYDALDEGGTVPAVLNASNEAAVGLFLEGKIKFTGIIDIVSKIVALHNKKDDPSLDDIINSEKWAREMVFKEITRI